MKNRSNIVTTNFKGMSKLFRNTKITLHWVLLDIRLKETSFIQNRSNYPIADCMFLLAITLFMPQDWETEFWFSEGPKGRRGLSQTADERLLVVIRKNIYQSIRLLSIFRYNKWLLCLQGLEKNVRCTELFVAANFAVPRSTKYYYYIIYIISGRSLEIFSP